MKAAVMRGGKIVADEIDAPKPAAGEVLVKTLACGICGSDLHTLSHGHDLVEKSKQTGSALNVLSQFLVLYAAHLWVMSDQSLSVPFALMPNQKTECLIILF